MVQRQQQNVVRNSAPTCFSLSAVSILSSGVASLQCIFATAVLAAIATLCFSRLLLSHNFGLDPLSWRRLLRSHRSVLVAMPPKTRKRPPCRQAPVPGRVDPPIEELSGLVSDDLSDRLLAAAEAIPRDMFSFDGEPGADFDDANSPWLEFRVTQGGKVKLPLVLAGTAQDFSDAILTLSALTGGLKVNRCFLNLIRQYEATGHRQCALRPHLDTGEAHRDAYPPPRPVYWWSPRGQCSRGRLLQEEGW